MNLKQLVRESYHEAVTLHPSAPSDLKRALKSHERVPAFIDNLAVQLAKVEEARKKPTQIKHIKEIIAFYVDTFIIDLETKANRMKESEIQKKMREAKISQKMDLENSASGNLKGDYADLVKEGEIIITEEREN